ncbi:MAG TPA: N-acetyltransferase family protein [Thiolinea sp.]|nr:N-acetyltransferase family protein [Thiolinea sp.]
MIRTALPTDAAAIVALYNYYVLNTTITFEEQPVSSETMTQRLHAVQNEAGLPWLVLEQDGVLAGYACANRWMSRSAYRFAVEATVYLAAGQEGRGLGRTLYGALFDALRQHDLHTVLGIIALPNAASVALHEKMGMQKVAHFREVGYKFGRWLDVGYWQMLL